MPMVPKKKVKKKAPIKKKAAKRKVKDLHHNPFGPSFGRV